MNKQELMKKCNEIILATNGGNDDYVVALCRISEAISKLEESKECENISQDMQFICSSCNWGIHALNRCLVNLSDEGDNGYYAYDVNYCPNCGSKIKREKSDE